MFKVLILKLFKINVLNHTEDDFVRIVKGYDNIHFCGGGNFYSIYVPWLYYAFFIIFLGWLEKKPLILTSQTIGPFYGIDKVVASLFLNMTSLIAVREPPDIKLRSVFGVVFPRIYSMLDASYYLPKESKISLKKTKKLRIGLCLHAWEKYNSVIESEVKKLLIKLNQDISCEIILIPHIISKNNKDWDTGYMKGVIDKLPKTIKVFNFTYNKIVKSSPKDPSMTIKFLTSKCDLLISSRYHGVVFGLSENIPQVVFLMGNYYRYKNQKALEFVYGKHYKKYIVDLDKEKISEQILQKTLNILNKLDSEKAFLKKRNMQLKRNKNLFSLSNIYCLQ